MENELAHSGARAVYLAFDSYQSRFSIITRRAQARFEHRDWMGMRSDAAERLDVYNTVVNSVVCELHKIFEGRLQDKALWRQMKEEYSTMTLHRNDYELGETFYNSVTRRIFATVGVDSQVEFVDTDFTRVAAPVEHSIVREYTGSDVPAVVRCILQDLRFGVPFQDFERDVHFAAREITNTLRSFSPTACLQSVQLVRSISSAAVGLMLSAGCCVLKSRFLWHCHF